MKKIVYITGSILLSLLMVLWYGCDDKNKESESYGSIYGMVSEAGTAEPMRGTGVELYYLNGQGTAGALLLRTTTADDGSYSFDDVKAGEYLLRVEIPGYKRTEYKVVVESGRSARADMQVLAKGEGDEETDEVYVIKAANLMVQKEDLGKGSWSTADAMCKASTLAGYTDWRLPTKDELMILYINRSLIGGFSSLVEYRSTYWSSSDNAGKYYCINFWNGNISINYSSDSYYVRAVRSVNLSTSEEPGEPYVTIPALNLMVQKEDLGAVDFYSAVGLCEGAIIGGYTDWRLPTLKELQGLYVNRSMIGNFQTSRDRNLHPDYYPSYYWSSTIYDSATNTHSVLDFYDGTIDNSFDFDNHRKEGYYKFSVRAVRFINPPTSEESVDEYVAILE